jgi:hypothetical protein
MLCDIRDICAAEFPAEDVAHNAETGRPDDGPRLASKLLLDKLHAVKGRTARSLEAGAQQPLELSAADRVMRNFRARMRAQRPRHG